MRDAIVTGYDGSQGARDALVLGTRLAAATGRPLELVCVRPPGIPEWETERSQNKELVERRAHAVLDAAPVAAAVERHLIVDESVARGLQQYAAESGASVIVVGCPDRTRPGPIEAATVAERLLRGSPCIVALAPGGYAGSEGRGFHRIVVGYHASDEARAALRTAAALARACGATVRVVSVTGPAPAVEDADGAVHRLAHADLDCALRALASSVPVEGHLLEGDPTDRVLEQASGWADLILTGSRGHGPARRVLLGSVSAGLLDRAGVPVIVTPRGADIDLIEDAPAPLSAGARV
jgi:nucleotide-binding universal stress UspA family protein